MTPERWQQIKVILDGALEREGSERAGFVEAACQGDDELRREVESLAAEEAEIGDFIETPVFRIRLEEVEPLAVGERVGVWRIVREIGRGGMGAVYLAERADQEFEQTVAIKVVRRGMDTDEIVRRFRSERQILAHLDHPNIAKLFDGGTTADGRPYFVMEYVEGRPIDEFCADRKLPVRERLELFQRVCEAIHFAHQNLIVHRDLKPGNILVTADGAAKLLDFGIAKLLDPAQEPFALTRLDLRPMTPEYASPEQIRGEPITTASDVYSLGVLLYLLLTGQRPYRPTTDPQALADAICKTEPLRPSSAIARAGQTPPDGETKLLRRQVEGDLDNIVLMAMRKEPQRRYSSADQLSNDIGRHLEGLPVTARKDTLGYRTRKFVGRHRVGVSLAAAALLLIVGFSITVTLLWQRSERSRERAQAVLGFLDDLFSVPDPKQSRGESITARQVLDRGARRIDMSFATQPEVRADLMSKMAQVYLSLGVPDRAEQLFKAALDSHRRTLRQNDPRIANDLHNLASTMRYLGHDSDAEPLIRQALDLQRQQGATNNIEYARGLTNLAAILEAKGDFDQAERLYKEGLAIKRTLPKMDRDIAVSLNNLGKLAQTRGDLVTAETYYRQSLDIRRKLAGGQPDPDVALALNNLASLLQDRGDLVGSETNYREALALRRKLYTDPNASLASTLNNLGYLLQARGDFTGAESCFREALSIADKTLKRDHPTRAVLLRNLAAVLVSQRKAAEAEPLAREALGIFRAKMPKSWRVADTESVLGGCLTALGRFSEAEPLLLESYPILQKDKGDGAKHAAEARQRIVDLYTAWGKPERLAAYRT